MQDTFSVVDHPLVQHKLTLMRDKNCPTAHFRQLIREIALLLAYEVTRDLPLAQTQVQTPLETMEAPILAGKKLCFISVLRAGEHVCAGKLLKQVAACNFDDGDCPAPSPDPLPPASGRHQRLKPRTFPGAPRPRRLCLVRHRRPSRGCCIAATARSRGSACRARACRARASRARAR